MPNPIDNPEQPENPKSAALPADKARGGSWGFYLRFLASLAVALGILLLLLRQPGDRHDQTGHGHSAERELVVEAVGPRKILLKPGSSLVRKLGTIQIATSQISTPLLRTTGTVVASLRPFGADNEERWQFDDPEILAAYHEWLLSQVDKAFAQEQLQRMQALSETRYGAKKRIVERFERLVAAGTDAMADLETVRAELLEQEIEGRRDVHEAETELRRAQQTEAISVRHLQLAGLDPDMFGEATKDVDIVVADVPEEFLGRVRVGQQCEARFFGLSKLVFAGKVRSLAPVLSPERRSLRVLFFVDDEEDRLRPGMFAEIGLGTEAREAILVPSESVIHIGRDDFVLVQSQQKADVWEVVPVDVGDTNQGKVEIISGLTVGDTIISQGAILLKPVAADSLRLVAERADDVPPLEPVSNAAPRRMILPQEDGSG